MNSTVSECRLFRKTLCFCSCSSIHKTVKTEHQPECKQPPRTNWVFTLTLSSTTLWLLWPLLLWRLLHLLQHGLCSYKTKSLCWTRATEQVRSLWEYCSKRFVVQRARYDSNVTTFHEEFHWGDQIWVCARDGGCDCEWHMFELLVE